MLRFVDYFLSFYFNQKTLEQKEYQIKRKIARWRDFLYADKKSSSMLLMTIRSFPCFILHYNTIQYNYIVMINSFYKESELCKCVCILIYLSIYPPISSILSIYIHFSLSMCVVYACKFGCFRFFLLPLTLLLLLPLHWTIVVWPFALQMQIFM